MPSSPTSYDKGVNLTSLPSSTTAFPRLALSVMAGWETPKDSLSVRIGLGSRSDEMWV